PTISERDWSADVCSSDLVHERIQDGPVHPIQAKSVDLVQLQSHTGGLQRQHPVPTHFGVVTYTAQEPIGDPGRTTRPARDLPSGDPEERRVGEECGGA